MYRINEILDPEDDRYVREIHGVVGGIPDNYNGTAGLPTEVMKETNLKAFYTKVCKSDIPVMIAILGRETITEFRGRNKKTNPVHPDTPIAPRQVYIDAPPPSSRDYKDVDDSNLDADELVAFRGIPKSVKGFEKQLAEHKLKRDAHEKLIETLKAEREKFGDTGAINSDDDAWDYYKKRAPMVTLANGILSDNAIKVARKNALRDMEKEKKKVAGAEEVEDSSSSSSGLFTDSE